MRILPLTSIHCGAVTLKIVRGKDKDGNKTKADKAKVEEFRKGLTALGDIYISMLEIAQRCTRGH